MLHGLYAPAPVRHPGSPRVLRYPKETAAFLRSLCTVFTGVLLSPDIQRLIVCANFDGCMFAGFSGVEPETLGLDPECVAVTLKSQFLPVKEG